MRPQWYSDKRDLVKWGALLHLARLHGAGSILQIAMLRPSTFPQLELDGVSTALPEEVVAHFRGISGVSKMVRQPRIKVFEYEFRDRASYFVHATTFVKKARGNNRTILFVDPDTGLAPKKTKHEHITAKECRDIFQALKPGDLFVLYQHKPLYGRAEWIEKGRQNFAAALELDWKQVRTITAQKIANDVAFYVASREG